MGDAELQRVADAELALLQPDVRASREQLEMLLADDFVEIGASGRLWKRGAMIADLLESPALQVTVEGMTVRLVADRVAVVTYETVSADRRVIRSSWWRESGGRWTCFFHQGTPASAPDRGGSQMH